MIKTEKFTADFLEQVVKDGQRCRVELNNGDVLETSSLCLIHKNLDGSIRGLGLDASGQFRGSEMMPANLDSAITQQIFTIPLQSIKGITILQGQQTGQPAPSLDKASF